MPFSHFTLFSHIFPIPYRTQPERQPANRGSHSLLRADSSGVALAKSEAATTAERGLPSTWYQGTLGTLGILGGQMDH